MGKGEIHFTPPNKKAASASAAASPPWAELPVELTENILQRLGVVDILESAQKVCAPWRKVCEHPSLWRVINMIQTRNKYDDDCEVMFRHAVNRSQGQLTDLTIAAIVDQKLLGYIADRSSHLRRLTLAFCESSLSTLSEAVKKLPELEELHIFLPMPTYISSVDIETIGKSCPMLKSFTYNQPRCNHPSPEYYSEEEEVPKADYNTHRPKIEAKPEAASIDHDHLHHDCEVKEEEKEEEREEEEKEEEKEEEREEEEKEEEMEVQREEEPEADYNNYSPKIEAKPAAAYNNHDHLHHDYVEVDDEVEDDEEEEEEDVEMEGYHEFYENYEFLGSVPYESDDNRYDINNEDAKAIARTMPNLQHIGLVANDLTNKGLKFILEGCPRLESLDLRMCYGVFLQGKVWRRCCEQIKDVKLPRDSIDEHPYAWKHRRRSPYMKKADWFEYISTL